MKPNFKLYISTANIYLTVKNIFFLSVGSKSPNLSSFIFLKILKNNFYLIFAKHVSSFHHLCKQKYTAKKFIIDDGWNLPELILVLLLIKNLLTIFIISIFCN